MLLNGRGDLLIVTQPGGKATQEGKLGKDGLRVQGDDQPLGAGARSRTGKQRKPHGNRKVTVSVPAFILGGESKGA